MSASRYATAWQALANAIGEVVDETLRLPSLPVPPEDRGRLGAEALSTAYLSFLASIGLSNAKIAEVLRTMASQVERGEAQASAVAMVRAAKGRNGSAS